MSAVLGIDIGTSYFSGAVWLMNDCYIIANDESVQRIPSFVTYHSRTQQTVGEPAKLCTDELHKIFYNIKIILGRMYSDPKIQTIKTVFPYVIYGDDNDKPILKIPLPDETLTLRPDDVQSSFIHYMKRLAEERLGQSVDRAVVAVPAYFNDHQRQATIDACTKVRIKVLKLINEPTAAIMGAYYVCNQSVEPDNNVIVFDMGSSTTKVTMVTTEEGATFKTRKVIIFNGIGGNHFDHRIIVSIIRYIRTRYNTIFIPSMRNVKRILNIVEESKILLSSSNETSLEIIDGDRKYEVVLTREKLEQLCSNLLRILKSFLHEVLRVTRTLNFKIDKVLIMGGACKIPMVKNKISEFFGRELVLEASDTMVAVGAAIRAGMLTGQLPEQLHDLLPVDRLPNTLGVSRNYSVMVIAVKKGVKLPCTRHVWLALEYNDVINVMEGEGLTSLENRSLGSILVTGVRTAKHAMVKVTFEVTVYCIVNVTLEIIDTGEILHLKVYANEPKVPLNEFPVQNTESPTVES